MQHMFEYCEWSITFVDECVGLKKESLTDMMLLVANSANMK